MPQVSAAPQPDDGLSVEAGDPPQPSHREAGDGLEHPVGGLHLLDDQPADAGDIRCLDLRDDVVLAGDCVRLEHAILTLQRVDHLERLARGRGDEHVRTDHVLPSIGGWWTRVAWGYAVGNRAALGGTAGG